MEISQVTQISWMFFVLRADFMSSDESDVEDMPTEQDPASSGESD